MTLNMKNLNCVRFILAIQFDEKNFRKKEFLQDIGKKTLKREELIGFSYGSKNKRKKEHSHILLSLNKKESSLKLVYHLGKSEDEDVREPYMEESPQWIASFLNQEEFDAEVSTAFRYSNEFESQLKLQYPLYPLLLENKLYENALLSGHQIEFSDDSLVERIFLSAIKDTIAVVVNGSISIKLPELNTYKEIKRFSEYARSLVKKKEEKNA